MNLRLLAEVSYAEIMSGKLRAPSWRGFAVLRWPVTFPIGVYPAGASCAALALRLAPPAPRDPRAARRAGHAPSQARITAPR